MRLFSNLPLILVLVGSWPLVLMGLVVGCCWLERRTLADKPAERRRRRRRPPRLRLRRPTPDQVEELVLKETAQVVARYLAATGDSSPAQHQSHTPTPAAPQRSGAARRA